MAVIVSGGAADTSDKVNRTGDVMTGPLSTYAMQYTTIPAGETITIPTGTQMIVAGSLTVDGTLVQDGTLVIVPDDALSAANNLSDVADVATARDNLQLGTASIADSTDFDVAGAAAAVGAQIISVTLPVGLSSGGVDDNAAAIQNAIDGLGAAGGIIHIPAGTYKLAAHCLEIIDKSGVILQGAGMGVTILDASGTPGMASYTDRGLYNRGVITIDETTTGHNNITIRDLTVKAPTTGSDPYLKAIYTNGCENVTIQRVKVDGSKYEAIYCEGAGGTRKNYRVVNCEVCNHSMTAIDINETSGNVQYVQNNYIHDGGGIAIRGERAVVTGNVILDTIGVGIGLYQEGTGVYHTDNVIANNIISGTSAGSSLTVYGIYINARTDYDNGGIIVRDNVISDILQESGKGLYGIQATGAVSIIGNTIRGTTGSGATSQIAIATTADNGRMYVADNVIEPVATDANRWHYGILCSGDGNAIFANNIVYATSVGDGVGIPFRDLQGAAILMGNIFQGVTNYGTATINNGGELNNTPLSARSHNIAMSPMQPHLLTHSHLTWTAADVSGGSASLLRAGVFDMRSGAGANGTARYTVADDRISIGRTYASGFATWTRRVEILTHITSIIVNTQGVFRGVFGKLNTAGMGLVTSGDYIGWTVENDTLTTGFVCKANTVTSVALTPVQVNADYGLSIYVTSHNGTVRWYGNGVLVGTTAAGPIRTNQGGSLNYEINNGATAANYIVQFWSQSAGY
jgi:hypothetical protein